jgi:hypothetical protein
MKTFELIREEQQQLQENPAAVAIVLGLRIAKILKQSKNLRNAANLAKGKEIIDDLVVESPNIRPTTAVRKTAVRKLLEALNVEPNLIGIILALIIGAIAIIALIIAFSAGKTVKDLVVYFNNKVKAIKGKIKKIADRKDMKILENGLTA